MSEKSETLSLEKVEQSLGLDEAFNPSRFVTNSSSTRRKGQKSLSVARERSFEQICKAIRDELNDELASDKGLNIERQHDAVIGDKTAMGYYISKISEALRKLNITTDDYPDYFSSLAEAIFHNVWGVGLLHKWESYPESEAAVIRGQELWIDINGKMQIQPERFPSKEEVERIRRTFTNRIADAVINEQNPELEIEREDGTRITMLQPKRSKENYIMFRRFIVKNFSLEKQASLGTIPSEDIGIYSALSKVLCNIIIAGRVRSAKSTFMKTLIKEREDSYIAAAMEKHFELNLTESFPDRLIFEIQAKEGDLHKAVPRLLRMEHDYIVVGEIRGIEAEAYLQSTERGERGALSTYHLTDVENVVPQITRHILDEFPSRKFDTELERVARNIDIIITTTSDRDRRKKRVLGVTEIIWDESERKVVTNDLIRYSTVTDSYYYSSNISKKLQRLMADQNQEETERLLKLLKQRERQHPMHEYHSNLDKYLDEMTGGLNE
ncbi:ATPase, T2SS/T4P/T4SS family [Bacillus swezeyi]|uniref:Secretion system protein E n=1 Tax=Bacillus swezeyi TaxID=1925020 RepID=A0A5M8RIN8_9BACI|nr:ATPase, T2SS/T4P/T4SS family [Bacillus swezeyi]KAA6446913.1 secretion system protein E [Bacillus swezeyi]KAA6471481.1 secretion system protein E [Bacillus swezeyi]